MSQKIWKDNNTINNFTLKFNLLSNFSQLPILFNGITFRSIEHAYQTMKTDDLEWRQKIIDAPTPGKAKRIGKKAPLRANWDDIKVDIMEHLLRIKFTNPWFKEFLRKTKPKRLIEGNKWHDNFWGNCSCDSCKDTPGENMLGKLLMKIREEIPDPFKE